MFLSSCGRELHGWDQSDGIKKVRPVRYWMLVNSGELVELPFPRGNRNVGGTLEAEGALPRLCPCCTEKQWTSRGDASQASGLEVGLMQTPSVCKGQRKPRAMNLALHVSGIHGRDVEHEIQSREVAEGLWKDMGCERHSLLSGRSLRNHLGHLYSPLGLPILFLPLMFWSLL